MGIIKIERKIIMIRPLVNETVTILTQKQVPKFFQSLAKQIEIPLNCSRIKTGVIAKNLVGIDDTGWFIASQGSILPRGDIATTSSFGYIESGMFSKIVPKNKSSNIKEYFANLSEQLKLSFDMNRTKTGTIDGKLFAIDDTGRFISSKRELLPNGDWGTISQVGKVEGVASKIVPQKDIATMTITKRS